MKNLKFGAIIILLSILMNTTSAKDTKKGNSEDLTVNERNKIVETLISELSEKYVDPNLGKKAADYIRLKNEQNSYDHLDNKMKFAQILTADIQKETNDKHLQLINPKLHENIKVFNPNSKSQSSRAENKLIQQMLKKSNYGFKKTEILDSNIGYLDIRQFVSPKMAPDVLKAIDKQMKTIQECSAVIIDLRWCAAGGAPETMMYLVSHFFGKKEPVLFYEVYDREKKKINEYYTTTDIQGKPMPEIPLYILVSPKTFSAGEMMAYGLQKIGRAKVIGEVTAGAAHATDTISIGHGFMMVMPVNRIAHSVTKSNWQGTGVIPDKISTFDDTLPLAIEIIKNQSPI